MTTTSSREIYDSLRSLEPQIRAAADEIEMSRRVPRALVDKMQRAGLFSMLLPRDLGGREVDPLAMFRVIEEASRIDGSAGWIVAIGSGTPGFMVPFLDTETAHAIFLENPAAISGGTFAPRGKAIPVDGGFRVSGHWPFASGIEHCDWLIGGCFVFDGDRPVTGKDGAPLVHIAVFPASECQIHDTWDVVGLRGTGSHDFSVADLFVPKSHMTSPFSQNPTRTEPQYAILFFLIAHAANALGIARHAIDVFTEFASKASAGPARVREKPLAQLRAAQSEALVGSARAFIIAATEDAWETAQMGQAVSQDQRARIRLAMTNAVHSSAQAVDLMYDAAGGYAIYNRNPLERCFRDIHTATQHSVVASPSYEMLGRYLLDVEPQMVLM